MSLIKRIKRAAQAMVEPQVDHGSRGEANKCRPSRMGETIQAGVTYRAYLDSHLIDRMHTRSQLSDLQHDVAVRVMEMHMAAGFEPSVTPGYSPPGWRRGHDDDQEEAEAITRFRRLLGCCSQAAATILHGMCLDQHPGVQRLGLLQAALDDLAKRWGME